MWVQAHGTVRQVLLSWHSPRPDAWLPEWEEGFAALINPVAAEMQLFPLTKRSVGTELDYQVPLFVEAARTPRCLILHTQSYWCEGNTLFPFFYGGAFIFLAV